MTTEYTPDTEAPRLLDDETARDVIERVKQMSGEKGGLIVTVQSWWGGGQRWARNLASMTSDQRDIMVTIVREVDGAQKSVRTNQLDSDTLRSAVQFATHYASQYGSNAENDLEIRSPEFPIKGAKVWSDKTYDRSPDENGRVVHALVRRSTEKGFLSAGYIETIGARIMRYTRNVYGRESLRTGEVTQAQCSVTVRHPKGTGSGWAGNSSFEIARIDMQQISDRAFDKCLQSLDPVRIEPGRYQTILEPQAVASLAQILFTSMRYRSVPENRMPSPFILGPDAALQRIRSKLGLRIVDSRLSLYHDPEDPLSGTHPEVGIDRVQLINKGVLTSLMHDYSYAQRELYHTHYDAWRPSFVLGEGTTSVEEMISTMKRGLLVTRFSDPKVINAESLLCTGLTRDGLWLIENGKITKAIRNFRWTESPLFAFNNVVDIGPSVPVFSPDDSKRFPFEQEFQDAITTIVVPAMKVNDFSFTSTIDAI